MKGAGDDGQVVHRHDERQGKGRRARRSDRRGLVVDDRLHDPVTQAGKRGAGEQREPMVEHPKGCQSEAEQRQRDEVRQPFEGGR